jgi:glutamyl-tRNA synthetase
MVRVAVGLEDVRDLQGRSGRVVAMSAGLSARPVRTRIAPSPTGFLHLGTARTALFSLGLRAPLRRHLRAAHRGHRRRAFHAGRRRPDPRRDALARLDHDEGPYYQMQRLERYHEVAEQMLADGTAYRCWCTPEELDAMREAQRARGEKTRYDGRWRPEPGKTLPRRRRACSRWCAFATRRRLVTWDDLVKGPISDRNRRSTTSSSCVRARVRRRDRSVPDLQLRRRRRRLDMGITHVLRGDEHINNTPWQINILRALGHRRRAAAYGHCPMILGDDGEKLSASAAAPSACCLPRGRLPARGDAQLPGAAGLEPWRRRAVHARADGAVVRRQPPGEEPAQWDAAKLATGSMRSTSSVPTTSGWPRWCAQLAARGVQGTTPGGCRPCALFKDRCSTLVELADWTGDVLFEPCTPARTNWPRMSPTPCGRRCALRAAWPRCLGQAASPQR